MAFTPSVAAFEQCGTGSWYGPGFHGKLTASGETFNQNSLTAAHRKLDFGSKVRIINQENGRELTVTINDRGPFHGNRIIDLSKEAASQLGFQRKGTASLCLKLEGTQ